LCSESHRRAGHPTSYEEISLATHKTIEPHHRAPPHARLTAVFRWIDTCGLHDRWLALNIASNSPLSRPKYLRS
jgi:hypothetical protein